MTSPPFDISTATRALEAAGAERPRAEAIISAIGHTGRIVTKTELSSLETRMEARSSSLAARVYRPSGSRGQGHRGHPHHLEAACVAVPSGLIPA